MKRAVACLIAVSMLVSFAALFSCNVEENSQSAVISDVMSETELSEESSESAIAEPNRGIKIYIERGKDMKFDWGTIVTENILIAYDSVNRRFCITCDSRTEEMIGDSVSESVIYYDENGMYRRIKSEDAFGENITDTEEAYLYGEIFGNNGNQFEMRLINAFAASVLSLFNGEDNESPDRDFEKLKNLCAKTTSENGNTVYSLGFTEIKGLISPVLEFVASECLSKTASEFIYGITGNEGEIDAFLDSIADIVNDETTVGEIFDLTVGEINKKTGIGLGVEDALEKLAIAVGEIAGFFGTSVDLHALYPSIKYLTVHDILLFFTDGEEITEDETDLLGYCIEKLKRTANEKKLGEVFFGTPEWEAAFVVLKKDISAFIADNSAGIRFILDEAGTVGEFVLYCRLANTEEGNESSYDFKMTVTGYIPENMEIPKVLKSKTE